LADCRTRGSPALVIPCYKQVMSAPDQLLVIQEHDTTIDQLTHKRATLPERTEREQVIEAISALDQAVVPLEEARKQVRFEQERLEHEVAMLEEKTTRENAKLYSGNVTGVKELQALQDEIASLKRHQGTLEEAIIEQMEAAEPLDAQLADLADKRTKAEARLTDVEQNITAAEAEIDVELDKEQGERTTAAGEVAEDLLERYEQARIDLGGIAIARYSGGVCGGCHIQMSAMEADRMKRAAPDQIVTCAECERILVR